MSNISRMQFLRGDIKGKSHPLRPPWAIPEQFFVDYCSRCDKCIDACFDELIVKGRGGFPQMDFKQGGCDFCEDCLNVCTSNALKKIPKPEKKSSINNPLSNTASKTNSRVKMQCSEEESSDAEQMNTLESFLPPWHIQAEINLSNCLSLNATICRSCGEACEHEAIKFNLQLGGIAEPVLNIDKCTGCGSCLSVCPVQVIKIKPATFKQEVA